MNFRSECDYFSVAVDMLFQFKRRATVLDLFASVDLSEINVVPGRTAWTCGTSACTSQTT